MASAEHWRKLLRSWVFGARLWNRRWMQRAIHCWRWTASSNTIRKNAHSPPQHEVLLASIRQLWAFAQWHTLCTFRPSGSERNVTVKVWLNPIQFCQPSEYIDALQTLRWIEVEMVRSTWSYGIRFKSGLPFPTNLVCLVCLLKVWKYPNNSHHAHTFLYPLLRKRQPHELTLVFRSLLCARVCWHTTKLSGIATSRQTLVGPQAAQVRPAVESWSETDCRFPGMETYNLRPFTFMSHSWVMRSIGQAKFCQ